METQEINHIFVPMTPEFILKGNEKIAIYLEAKCHLRAGLIYIQSLNFMGSLDELKFHEDWNLLMPLVHKIFDTTDEDTQEFKGLTLFELGIGTEIEDLFQAVVEFLDWLNKENID